MNNQDLRVLKTIDNIENAFFELLGSKPIEKITVAELARVARINKGTFYRHYLDIPGLYMKTMQKALSDPLAEADYLPCLFDDPERFMEEMSKMVMDNLSKVKLLLQNQDSWRNDGYFKLHYCCNIWLGRQ